jgi:tight adherence protein C
VTLAVLAGLGVGLGAWLVYSGLAPSHEPLERALARIGRSVPAADPSGSFDARLGARLRGVPVIDQLAGHVRADLRVLRKDLNEQTAEVVAFVVIGLLWAPVFTAGCRAIGVQIPLVIPVWLSLAGAVVAFVAWYRQLKAKAAEARTAFAHALSAYCDVVSMTVSAGYELHAAIFDAAARGDGWAFHEIRVALERGFLAGERPTASLAQLGRDLGVNDLVELAATLALADEEGAVVGDALTSKARSIRERLVADTERKAAGATERMAVPGAMVLIGFLWLLAYPALHLLLQEAGR